MLVQITTACYLIRRLIERSTTPTTNAYDANAGEISVIVSLRVSTRSNNVSCFAYFEFESAILARQCFLERLLSGNALDTGDSLAALLMAQNDVHFTPNLLPWPFRFLDFSKYDTQTHLEVSTIDNQIRLLLHA